MKALIYELLDDQILRQAGTKRETKIQRKKADGQVVLEGNFGIERE